MIAEALLHWRELLTFTFCVMLGTVLAQVILVPWIDRQIRRWRERRAYRSQR